MADSPLKVPQNVPALPARNADSNEKSDEALVPEVVEIVRQEQAQAIDVNVFLHNLPQDSQVGLAYFKEALEISKAFEEHRVDIFKQRTEAIIKYKGADPDEIEKRKNNSVRRVMRLTIAGVTVGAPICAVLVMLSIGISALTAPIIVLFLAIGGLSLSMMGPLASGESISSNDVVRLLNAASRAIGRMVRSNASDEKRPLPPTPSKKGGKK